MRDKKCYRKDVKKDYLCELKPYCVVEEKRKSRAGKLIKDVGIYAIGNLGSRLITFLLLPIYSFFIAVEDYGYYDLCFTTILFLMPFITFQMRDGSFRFLLDAESDEKRTEVVSFVLKTLMKNVGVCVLAALLINIATEVRFLWYSLVFAVVISLYEVYIQMVRGLGGSRDFVKGGIMTSFLIAAISLVLVIYVKMGVEAIFIGNIVGRILTLIYLESKTKVYLRYFNLRSNPSGIRREMLKFCLPLMPITTCIWVMSSSNRFFVAHFIGLEYAGLLAIAVKFQNILETLAYIFYQAWQETAIMQYKSEDKDKLYSRVFNAYVYVQSVLVIAVAFMLKANYGWIVDEQYFESWKYLYPLLISAVALSLSYFYEMAYQCSKDTMRSLPGYLLGSICNVGVSFALLQTCGVYSVLVGSVVSYMTLLVYRILDTRKYFKITLDKNNIYAIAVVVISGLAYYEIQTPIWLVAYMLISLISLMALVPKDMKEYVRGKLKEKLRRIK